MIIKLDDSIVEYLSENKDHLSWFSEEFCALENIILLAKNHKHIIIASIATIEYLQDFFSNSNSIRCNMSLSAVLDYMYKNYTYLKAYQDHVIVFVVATILCDQIEKHTNNEKEEICVPLKLLKNLDASRLYAENLDDAQFYKRFVQEIIDENNKDTGLEISMTTYGCGGSEIAHTISDPQLDTQFSVFIVDSDKGFPNEQCGATAYKANKEFQKHCATRVSSFHLINGRDVENLLSPQCYLYKKSCGSIITDSGQKKLLNFFDIHIHEHEEWWLYSDIKDGLTVEKCKKYIKKENQFYCKLLSQMSSENVSLRKFPFEQDDDTRYMFLPIGQRTNDFLENVLPTIRNNGEAVWDLLSVLLRAEWNVISAIIYSYGCSFPQTAMI